jgi:cysteinyl-tRNA synthetase
MFKVNNSLSKSLDNLEINGKTIKWYACGPTVYDSAHLGHARTYVVFDVIQRILENYGYTIQYVMNITDIDDKIIEKVVDIPGLTEENYNDIYQKFVREMESEFWVDMDSLNVKRPLVITRVMEYIDKMIKYIETLEDGGLAYCSNGSVYFDTQEYINRGLNFEPLKKVIDHNNCDKNDKNNDFISEKKDKKDFVLWKKTKFVGREISFPSRWGEGRVGWHLECSVMATDVLGQEFDIHSGGIDLIFPHHQNEIIQANGYKSLTNKKKKVGHVTIDDNKEWVKYFLHSGHLNINGLKMSKSLKNFTTIRDFLKHTNSRTLRILFVTHKWDKSMDFSMGSVNAAKRIDERIREIFATISFNLKNSAGNINKITWENKDVEMLNVISNMSIFFDKFMMNNFDTSSFMKYLMETISTVHKYMNGIFNYELLNRYSHAIRKYLNVMGIEYDDLLQESVLDNNKFVELGINLREDMRNIVVKNKKLIDKKVLGELFTTLDEFRDVKLLEAGVILQDMNNENDGKVDCGNKTKFSFKS